MLNRNQVRLPALKQQGCERMPECVHADARALQPTALQGFLPDDLQSRWVDPVAPVRGEQVIVVTRRPILEPVLDGLYQLLHHRDNPHLPTLAPDKPAISVTSSGWTVFHAMTLAFSAPHSKHLWTIWNPLPDLY